MSAVVISTGTSSGIGIFPNPMPDGAMKPGSETALRTAGVRWLQGSSIQAFESHGRILGAVRSSRGHRR